MEVITLKLTLSNNFNSLLFIFISSRWRLICECNRHCCRKTPRYYSSSTIPGTRHFKARHNSIGINMDRKCCYFIPFRSCSYLPYHCTCYSSIRWHSLDNSSVHSYLQSRKTSSESNPQSTSPSRCASNGTIPGEKGRFECCAFLRNFCLILSSEFLLYNIVNNG